jgi:hypothetical protein
MKYNRKGCEDTGGDGSDVPPSIRLDIAGQDRRDGALIGDGGGGSTSFFEPRRERTPGGYGSSGRSGGREPPEKRLTLFALRLAVLEKAASRLGKLDFVWATVVLLGGFADTLRIVDFWCVTVILLGEGARLFSRSHELEWQHHSTQTHTACGALRSSSRFVRRIAPAALANPASDDEDEGGRAAQFQRRVADFVKRRTWNAPEVSLLTYTGWVFVSGKAGRLLSWLQVLSALVCVALSCTRLWQHDFGAGDGARNKRPALLVFYTVALLEASLFLLEKAYWTWKLSFRKLMHQVSADCELGVYGPASLTRFFYDAYSRCVAGSIFDGVKMDLVAFAEDLILSDFLDEQLIGVRILQQIAGNDERDAMREVGTNPRSIERLIEMLNWKRPDEEEVRRCAAEVVSRLAGMRQNALRVSAIPGAIESVMSLLHTMHEATPVGLDYDHLPFNLLGLLILKRLATDHDNCGKIGSTRGLLAKIIDFTYAPLALLRDPHATDSQVRAVKRALQLVKMLVSATGSTGRALRQEVAENVFSVSYLRGILRHGRRHRELKKLAVDVLTGLAMEETGTQAVVRTGGVVKLLLTIFVGADEDGDLRREAGEALAMLALESETGCAAILKARHDDEVEQILPALQDGDARRLNATRLLRNLCAYSGPEHGESLRARRPRRCRRR